MIDEHRLLETFLELVRIDSPTGQEAELAGDLERRLRDLGGAVARDEHGNLVARWPDGAGPWLMLSAHMDTVGSDRGIKPLVEDGVVYSDGTTILGADDKAGIAVMLEVVQTLRERGLPHPPLELVFTVSEEVLLLGAKRLDKTALRARRGYVLDTGGPIGTIITGAPGQDQMELVFRGRRAHAGSEPEKGLSAIVVASDAIGRMTLGRIDEETTANVGTICGGEATNVVPDEVRCLAEARSRDPRKLASQVAHMTGAAEAVARDHGATVEIQIVHCHDPYHWTADTDALAQAAAAAARLGYAPVLRSSGGGSDANVFIPAGIECAVLSIGMVAEHTQHEHIAVVDLVACARWVLEIVTHGADS